jgi:hypothetical protein
MENRANKTQVHNVLSDEKELLNLYGMHSRFSRARGLNRLRRPLVEPAICMVIHRNSVKIQMEFFGQHSRLEALGRFKNPTLGLTDAFELILSLPNGHRTIGSELSAIATRAYAESQQRLLELAYLGRAPRAVDRSVQEMLKNIFQPLYTPQPGRDPVPSSQSRILKKLYRYYLPYARRLRKSAVAIAAASKYVNNDCLRLKDFRERLRLELKPDASRWEFMRAVLTGEVFKVMRGSLRREMALERPDFWTEEQLTIGLVAHYLNLRYETVQKKLAKLNRRG